jgi:phospholipid/cholesterol/gamma-HCH transport system ATP-binding protein
VIVFRNVDYWIGENQILRGVSFTVPEGQTKVILGPSGSGKSTILRLLLGLVKPDGGSILLDGEDVTRVPEDRMQTLRRRMGMVFQQGALFDSMTVGENVGYSLLEHADRTEKEVEAAVRAYLEIVGLDPNLIDRMPDQLSGGMQRRVAIARALAAQDPQFLLYDEPTTGLDPQSAERITDLIVELRDERRKTSIMVTHDIADAFKVANRITVLNEGRVVFEGLPPDLVASEDPFLRDFLAPFRKAMSVATKKLDTNGGAGPAPRRATGGGSPL